MNMNMWDHFVNKIIFKWTESYSWAGGNSSPWLDEQSGAAWTRTFSTPTSLPSSPIQPSDSSLGSPQACRGWLHGPFALKSSQAQQGRRFHPFLSFLCLTNEAMCDRSFQLDAERKSSHDANQGAECLRLTERLACKSKVQIRNTLESLKQAAIQHQLYRYK